MRKLFLIPSLLSETDSFEVLPSRVTDVIKDLTQFIVEDIREARRFLSKVVRNIKFAHLSFCVLNEHTKPNEISELLSFIQNSDTGIITDAGVPGVADPGAEIIRIAHLNNIQIVPLVGPSSILMALMSSGLNGQNFAFVGYLPIKTQERIKRIRELEKRSLIEKQTQIFIEAPYRNMQLLNDILSNCRISTLLTIAADITGRNEFIRTRTIKEWKEKIPELNKIPTVFLLQS